MRTQSVVFRTLLACVALALFVSAPLMSGQAAAGSFDVLVGYADNLRSSPFFPSPFFGDPSVSLFVGQNPSLFQLDSGAIMISNTGASSITLNDISATVPSWITGPTGTTASTGAGSTWFGAALPKTLIPGQNAIFVQTAQFNFDTSDFGIGIPPNPANNCSVGALSTSPGCIAARPSVTVTVDGTPTTFLDTGHVLDTGGFDSLNSNPCIGGNNVSGGNIPGACNESLQWRLIGTTGVENPGGGTSVPEPSSLLLLSMGLVAGLGARAWRRPRRLSLS